MMRFIVLAVVALLAGCDNRLLDSSGFELGDRKNVKGEFAGAYAIGGVFKPESTAFATSEFVVIGVDRVDQDNARHQYDAYVAAPPGGTVSGLLQLQSGALQFDSGWAYLTGMRPMATTNTISAVGDGTRFVLEILQDSPGASEHRIYLLPQLGTHSISIDDVNGAQITQLGQSARYVHIKNGVKIGEGHITSEPQRKTFIEGVRDAVKVHGMDWPLFWP